MEHRMPRDSTSHVEVRPAQVADAAAISALISKLAHTFIVPDCTADGAARLMESVSASAIARLIAEGYDYYVACVDGKTIGVVGTRGDSHLYHLFIDERFHRHGIARLLWQHA